MFRAHLMLAIACASCAACSPVLEAPAGDEGEGEGEGKGDDAPAVDEQEAEPNGGQPETAVNPLDVGTTMHGTVADADDVDVFHLQGGANLRVYRATVQPEGSGGIVDPRVVILDDGRNAEAAGADYVRIEHAPAGPSATVAFVLLGGSVYVAVDGEGSGGAYTLRVQDITDEATKAAVSTGRIDDALAAPGDVQLRPFEAASGSDVVFDLVADGTLDARLFVVSVATGDWIARNDNRSADEVNPRIDAPLLEDGPYLLLIENNEEAPDTGAFALTTTLP